MTREQFENLKVGDLIRHIGYDVFGLEPFVVTANWGDRVTAVRTADMTNPPEWELVQASCPICKRPLEGK